jgi:hypothetical protein
MQLSAFANNLARELRPLTPRGLTASDQEPSAFAESGPPGKGIALKHPTVRDVVIGRRSGNACEDGFTTAPLCPVYSPDAYIDSRVMAGADFVVASHT